MKKSKYQILDCLNKISGTEHGDITTLDIANQVGLSRGVVSLYLSQLLAEHLVEKYGTKPVYWRISPQKRKGIFDAFVGSTGSLESLIEECKAAVNYPPNGFPLILTGGSGVGKSFLASLIFKYAKEKGKVDENARFIALNCADYANNPELLSSVLFGYKKGAFTGANEDVPGLVAEADGGYLFLDEVHRLQKESQEKLFTLLDEGIYYPLGENKKPLQATIRFLFATTEKIEDTLLNTFYRRVPMHLELPSYKSRPIRERFQLIVQIFLNEAKQVKKNLTINNKIIIRLLNQEAPGNIGSLKNQIKLLCAKAFNEQQTAQTLHIGEADTHDLKINWEINSQNSLLKLMPFNTDIKALLNSIVKNSNLDILAKRLLIRKELKRVTKDTNFKNDLFVKMIEESIRVILKQINVRYGIFKTINEPDIFNAALLFYLIDEEMMDTIRQSKENKLQEKYARSYYLSDIITSKLGDIYPISEEKKNLFKTIFLYVLIGEEAYQLEKISFVAILLSHGSMATSIQEIVNGLVGNYVFEAFDMPLDVSMKKMSHSVNRYIGERNICHSGVILIFDMGSLSQMYKEIKYHLDEDLLVINNLTTSMALDIALQIQGQRSFKEIAEKAEEYSVLTSVQYYEGISQHGNIIVSCMSGVGLSEEIKKIMLNCLSNNTEIITMDYKDLKNNLKTHDLDYFEKTKFIITTTDTPPTKGLEIINIYDALEKEGSEKLRRLLLENGESIEAVDQVLESLVKLFTIEGISNRLQFLNPDIVIKEVQEIIVKYQQYYEKELDGKAKLSLYMHIALMIERMLVSSRKNEESFVIEKIIEPDKEEFFSISKNIFHNVETKYNITVDDYELSLMYELLKATFN